MRFVELRPSPDRGPVRLHPRITWLRGLDPASRVAIVGLVHDVALGEVPEWDGTVDVDGEEAPLADTVERVGETASSGLIVDAAGLPDTSEDVDEADETLRAGLEAAQAKLAELDRRIREIAEELEASGKVRSQMVAHLASSKGQVDRDAGPRLDRADAVLAGAARRAGRPDPWTGMADPAARIEELTATIVELDRIRAGLPSGDRPALAAASAVARAALAPEGGDAPCPDAAALAQSWISLHQRLRGVESRLEAAGLGTEELAARLEEAREEVRRTRAATVARRITPEEKAELEALNEAKLEAEQKAGTGLRRGAGRAELEEAVRTLQDALEPFGYPTWAAYRMGNGTVVVPDEALNAHDVACDELEALEREWADVMARLEDDDELQAVFDAIGKAREQAVALLGEDPAADHDGNWVEPIAEALRAVRIPGDSVGVDREVAMRNLRGALVDAGATGHEDLASDHALAALADSWLGVLEVADDLAVRLERDRRRASEELAALEARDTTDAADGGADLDRERAAVYEAEQAVGGTRAALAEVVRARLQLHALAVTEVSLAEEHDDRLLQRDSAEVVLEMAERRVAGRAARDAMAALLDRVPRGAVGPVPVVVVMGNAPADTLDRLSAFPEDVQILVIGNGEGADDWVARVGPEVAELVDVRTLV